MAILGENWEEFVSVTHLSLTTPRRKGRTMAIPDQTPGESEYDHGPGMFPNPAVDYDPQGSKSKTPYAPPTLLEQYRDMVASKRTNAADPSQPIEKMYEELGNPDRFGPAPALVQTPPVTQPPTPEEPREPTFVRKG